MPLGDNIYPDYTNSKFDIRYHRLKALVSDVGIATRDDGPAPHFHGFSDPPGGDFVESVTGLDTDNTDPYNPIVRISVDGVTITGDGTPGNPLVATGSGMTGLAVQDNGTLVGTQPIINFIPGNAIAFSIADDPGNTRVNVEIAANMRARINTDATTYLQPRLNFIEGTGIALTIGNSSGDIDITIDATGGSPMRFGVSGEDDVAGEDRWFHMDGHTFFITGTSPTITIYDSGANNSIAFYTQDGGDPDYFAAIGIAADNDAVTNTRISLGATANTETGQLDVIPGYIEIKTNDVVFNQILRLRGNSTPANSTDAFLPVYALTMDDTYLYYRTSGGTWKKIAWGAF